MTETTAQATITIDGSRRDVWAALTDLDKISTYFMGARVETDWKPGHPITFNGDWKGQQYQDKGEVLGVEPERKLSFSHWSPLSGSDDVPANYHVVAFELDDAGDATKVTLTQSNLEGGVSANDRKNRDEYEKNWCSVLEGLKRAVVEN